MDIFLSLVGFWYQIMNLYWIVSPHLVESPSAMHPGPESGPEENTGFTYCDGVGWLRIESIFFNVWKELLNYSVLLLSISKVVVSMLVIMMSVFCPNNYLRVLATPLVILETGESLGTPGRWDMTHFQSTNSHLVDFQPITPITLSRPVTRRRSEMRSMTQHPVLSRHYSYPTQDHHNNVTRPVMSLSPSLTRSHPDQGHHYCGQCPNICSRSHHWHRFQCLTSQLSPHLRPSSQVKLSLAAKFQSMMAEDTWHCWCPVW